MPERWAPTPIIAAVMDFESAGTFCPSVVNMISGARRAHSIHRAGGTAARRDQGTARHMSAVEPLDQIEKCVQPSVGSVQTVEDTCVAALGTAAAGEDDE